MRAIHLSHVLSFAVLLPLLFAAAGGCSSQAKTGESDSTPVTEPGDLTAVVNGEYLTVTNTTSESIDLTQYCVGLNEDEVSACYPLTKTLEPKAAITLPLYELEGTGLKPGDTLLLHFNYMQAGADKDLELHIQN